jgi:hypothetical protein
LFQQLMLYAAQQAQLAENENCTMTVVTLVQAEKAAALCGVEQEGAAWSKSSH